MRSYNQITKLMFCKVTDKTSNLSHPGLKDVRLQLVCQLETRRKINYAE